MSKNDIVECVHWDPEVDIPAQAARQKNRWVLLAGVLVVIAVAVGVSLLLFLPRQDTGPIEPLAEPGQTTYAPDLTEETRTQPPPAEDPYFAQGKRFYDSGNYAQAIVALNQSIAANPDSGAAYTYRGLSQFSMGSYQAATQDFYQAMVRMGESAELYTLRGTSYYMLGQYTEAIGDLTKGIELNPGSVNAYTYRALAYEATGRMDLAAADRARIGQ